MTTAEMLKSKPGVVGATIITRSGHYFDFLDPKPETIHIEDIAWALAFTCRFGGQSLHYYSVAQHSILVAETVDFPLRLQALMHDAAEAYVGDVVGPLKQLLPDYKVVEKRVEAAIAERFGLPVQMHPDIKHADLRLLRTEQRDLTSGHADSWNGLDAYPPLQQRIVPMTPSEAAHAFLRKYEVLTTYTRSNGPNGPTQIGIGSFGVFATKEIADQKAADMIALNPTVKLDFLGSYADGDGPPEADQK